VPTAHDLKFYELENPPRVVRVKTDAAAAELLTSAGWRRTPWLDRRMRRRPLGEAAGAEALHRRSRQRLSDIDPHADASGLAGIWAWVGLLVNWVLPPLPYGAPSRHSRNAYDAAKVAHREELTASLSETQVRALIDQAMKGHERQELRLTEIEHRASGFEGYATAVAGVAAVGAALIGSIGDAHPSALRLSVIWIALVGAVVCLNVSGFRAWQAAAKPFDWVRPNEPWVIVLRANSPALVAELDLLLSALVSADRGRFLADWKRERFMQSSRFFAIALIFVIVGALVILIHQA